MVRRRIGLLELRPAPGHHQRIDVSVFHLAMHHQLAALRKHRLEHGLQHLLPRLRLLPLRPILVGNARVDIVALRHRPLRKTLYLVQPEHRTPSHLRHISRHQQRVPQTGVRHAIAVRRRPEWQSIAKSPYRSLVFPDRNHIEHIRPGRRSSCRCWLSFHGTRTRRSARRRWRARCLRNRHPHTNKSHR